MEELTDNAEEHEDEASKVSEQKLGKLQYKVKEIFLCFITIFVGLEGSHERGKINFLMLYITKIFNGIER